MFQWFHTSIPSFFACGTLPHRLRKWTTVSGDICHQSFFLGPYPNISQQTWGWVFRHGYSSYSHSHRRTWKPLAVRTKRGSIIVQGTEIQSITMKNSSLVILASWETSLTRQTCQCVWKWKIPAYPNNGDISQGWWQTIWDLGGTLFSETPKCPGKKRDLYHVNICQMVTQFDQQNWSWTFTTNPLFTRWSA